MDTWTIAAIIFLGFVAWQFVGILLLRWMTTDLSRTSEFFGSWIIMILGPITIVLAVICGIYSAISESISRRRRDQATLKALAEEALAARRYENATSRQEEIG